VPELNQAEVVGDPGLGEDDLASSWRQLAELRENPFLTPEWYRAWLATNPAAEEPFLIAWRVEGEVRGVLPLVRVGKGPARLLRFAGARRGDWFTPACRLEDEPAMAVACAELLKRERGASRIRLDRIDCESAWPQALWGAGTEQVIAPARPRRTDTLPYIAFGDEGYEGYLAGRSRNFRSQLGRRRRKLEREHELSFRLTTEAERLEADFDTFFRLHDERWEDRGGSSSDSEAVRAFQREFAAAALERGWLRLWIAEADGAPQAAWYGWRIGGRYCYSLSGLSKDYERLALGTVLLAHTIEQAAAEGAGIYDLMWGDEGYKQRFETGQRDAATWVLARRGQPLRFTTGIRTSLERRLRGIRGER
jgi:CelD/BcsL family acetyltransferase involved in cellulose biosynthesis